MRLAIRRSKIHSVGCYTRTSIKRGKWIVEYTGQRLTVKQADRKYRHAAKTYLFGLTDGKTIIDGDGLAAFINHSCEPNCKIIERQGRIWVVAERDIKAGEELSYDYSLYDGDLGDPSLCFCGAKACRGSMYCEEELVKREKMLSEAAKKRTRKRKR
jgi:SET domain-containing protein